MSGNNVGGAVRVLVVDDDAVDRRFVERALAQGGLEVAITEASDADQALAALTSRPFDCILLDFQIPGRDGLWVLRAARAAGVDTPVVMLTGHGDEATAVSLMKAGAADYLAKGALSSGRLVSAVRTAIRVHHAERDAAAAAKALEDSEERLRIALYATELGIWDYHPATGNIDSDARGKSLFGLPPDAVMTYELLLSSLHADDRDRTHQAIQRALDPASGGECDMLYRLQTSPGQEELWVRATGRAFFGEGASRRLIGTVQDVTARKRYEEAARRQTEFEQQLVGIVSHDLRNPLQAMMMGAHAALMREDIDPALAKTLARIVSSGERAARMISDLLDFTQARAGGGLPVSRHDMDLHEVARHTVGEVQMSAPDRTLWLEATGDGQGHWDPDRLAQIVTNLVSNALAYSPTGTPVTVRTAGEEDWMVLEVHNMGPAIPAEVVPTLFEPFRRGKGGGGNHRSIGLGLYIVKQIAVAHGGSVEVESAAETGTSFRIRLPRGGGDPG
ncbi:MAG TPA: ATP-binding protein [Kofleriaceae bacterium]|nr:ATP-binding protein [Kofleriaceae bacterium]